MHEQSRGRYDVALLAAACLALAALGGVLGMIGSFLTPYAPELLGVPIPVGVLIGVVGNAVLGVAAARGADSRWGAAAAALGWLVVVLLLGNQRPEGDLVVTSDAKGSAFLLLGVVAAAFGLGIGSGRLRPRRAASLPPSGRR